LESGLLSGSSSCSQC